jgi:hypothetical protein
MLTFYLCMYLMYLNLTGNKINIASCYYIFQDCDSSCAVLCECKTVYFNLYTCLHCTGIQIYLEILVSNVLMIVLLNN